MNHVNSTPLFTNVFCGDDDTTAYMALKLPVPGCFQSPEDKLPDWLLQRYKQARMSNLQVVMRNNSSCHAVPSLRSTRESTHKIGSRG